MHNFQLIERYNHERQTIKERIDESKHWLTSSSHSSISTKPFSLNRSKLDEQIVQFRQYHAQLRTHRHSFDSDINTPINHEQLFDEYDRNNLEQLAEQFHLLEQQANNYNERINRFSTRLNEFHLEHSHLIDNYSKRLRLYKEHIEQNDDINFSALQLLLNNDRDSPIDHQFYEQLIHDLLTSEQQIEDQHELEQYKIQVDDYRKQYDKFQEDLKSILNYRQDILNKYETNKSQIQDWLNTTDRLLKQYPNDLTLESCEQLLLQHQNLPIEQLQTSNQQLIQFYSSINLLHLYEQLKLDVNSNKHSNTTMIFQKQTDDLVENHRLMKEKILQYMEILKQIQQKLSKYQLAKQTAEKSLEKAKELVTLEENTILPLDNQQIEVLLEKYKHIAEQFKQMSPTIDEYKTAGLHLIDTAERYIDIEQYQNELTSIDKSWSEYVEYILDTLDYIQLHQEELREFQQLSNDLTQKLTEKIEQIDQVNDEQMAQVRQDLEKFYEQVELMNQKGEFLLQSSAINLQDDQENPIEKVLETINKVYDSLTMKCHVPIEPTDNEQIVSHHTDISDELTEQIRHHIDETDLAMNELSQLLVSSTTDIISAQPIKLSEQLLDNAAVQSELERRKIVLEQLQTNIDNLKQFIPNSNSNSSIQALDEKLALLNEHWLIMKQANDIRTENLLLTQTCANTYWSEHTELSKYLEQIEQDLSKIRTRSTSHEHIEREKSKFIQLTNEFEQQHLKYRQILDEHSSQLLTLIENNIEECQDVQRSRNDLENEWIRVQQHFHTCQQDFDQAMIESAEFNSKLERVSNWFDDASIPPTAANDTNEFERIRTFKEHLDCKYLDIVNLKQDYTDIEQAKQPDKIDDDRTNVVEQQLTTIDTKWSQLNEQIQEHKTLVYETAIRKNRIDDVISDITHSLEDCSSKLAVLDNTSLDMKQIEISIAKLRILLNDIELISYDIEQLKHNSNEDTNLVTKINIQWENLLKQATDRYRDFEKKLEQMKNKQKQLDHIYYQLDLIDKQVNECTIDTKFPLLIEQLEQIEREINEEFTNENHDELKKRLIDVKQRTLTKGQELIELAHSIELFHSSLQKFTEWLTETERYLNNQKPIQRRFGLIQNLLKQIDDHKLFQQQLQTYKEHLIDLDKLATHLKFVSPKKDSIFIRNSLIAVQQRWQKILTRTTERTKELQKAFQDMKKVR